MRIEQGRPKCEDGRLKKELRVYDFLDSLGIAYERVDHEAADTMEACKAVDELLDTKMCKNLFLCNRQKTDFYLLLMPGEKPFKTKELSSQIQSARLSFASPEDMEAYLDITPGSVSVMGLMNDLDGRVHLLVDRDLLEQEYMGCHPCVNTSSIKVRTTEIFGAFLQATKHEMRVVDLIGE